MDPQIIGLITVAIGAAVAAGFKAGQGSKGTPLAQRVAILEHDAKRQIKVEEDIGQIKRDLAKLHTLVAGKFPDND